MSPAGESWSPTAETIHPRPDRGSTVAGEDSEPDGGVGRSEPARFVAANRTLVRIAEHVAGQAAQRLGTMAILTAITGVGIAIALHTLRPELAAAQQTPLYRLSALFLVLAAVGLAALQRAKLARPQTLLDFGLLFEVAGGLAIALMDNSVALPESALHASTPVSAWIAVCVVVIPNRPWKSTTAAFTSAAMVPLGHLLAAHVIGYPPLSWSALAAYAVGPFFVAGWTPFISTRLHRMQEDLSRTQEYGSYHLERLLGRGGMGEVWLARHRFLRREAAVKLVLGGLLERRNASERQEIQRRFELEAQAIASLRSPHTVAIYDYGVAENGSLYYAMEFLHGLDAQKLVDEYGPQPAGRVIAFLQQACESLEEAHDIGLVHRDVKSSNLFICRLGKRTDFVKLLDFGLVKMLGDPARTGITMHGATGGTPAFMAPEQVCGDEVDARTDIYGLGCVAYFLLTGTAVFSKRTATATLLAHVTERPQAPSKRSELLIPESLEQVVMACLEKKREERPQSVADLRAMLDGCTDVTPWTEGDANQWWALHRPEPVRMAS